MIYLTALILIPSLAFGCLLAWLYWKRPAPKARDVALKILREWEEPS